MVCKKNKHVYTNVRVRWYLFWTSKRLIKQIASFWGEHSTSPGWALHMHFMDITEKIWIKVPKIHGRCPYQVYSHEVTSDLGCKLHLTGVGVGVGVRSRAPFLQHSWHFAPNRSDKEMANYSVITPQSLVTRQVQELIDGCAHKLLSKGLHLN